MREVEAGAKVSLFVGVQDAAREAGEVAGTVEEVGDSWEVDDVGANVEGDGEGGGFHGAVWGLMGGLAVVMGLGGWRNGWMWSGD